MIDVSRLAFGLIALFGVVFVAMIWGAWILLDRQFWKSVGIVTSIYSIYGSLVFSIAVIVAWAYDKAIWGFIFG